MTELGWRPFRRMADGNYVVSLEADDREMLKALPQQLQVAMLANPSGEAFRRLRPPAYANDDVAEKEYRALVGDELDESKGQALDTLSQTADATELTEQEMDAWARALNDIRLWLGTILDVTEDLDEDDIKDPGHVLYQVLTYLQGWVIDALSEG